MPEEAQVLAATAEVNAAEVSTTEAGESDAKQVPAWVTEECFADLLKENVKNFEKIIKFKACPALAAGENYSTIMVRVSIDVQLKDGSCNHVSYMLKVPHDNEQMRQLVALGKFFLPENTMYFDVIPELEQMYKEAGVDVTIAPKAYKFHKDPGELYVLLEDLCPQGFKNANRLEGLDMKHTECVLKLMAQLHAASACRVANKGAFSDVLMNGLNGDEVTRTIWQNVVSTIETTFLKHIKLYKECEKYYDAVKALFNGIVDDIFRLAKYDPEEFNILNHGDSWSNNILFKYTADGQIADTYYVDFQVSKYGSPAQDLLYFIITSVNIEFKLKRFDYMIRYYFEHLIDNLKLLKYSKKLPTLRELHMQLFKYGLWAFTSATMTMPGVLLDPTEMARFDNFLAEDEVGDNFKNALFSNKRYCTHIEQIIPWLYDRGLLEHDHLPEEKNSTSVVSDDVNQKTTPSDVPKFQEWITEEYFLNILKENIQNFEKVSRFEISPGTNACDNYASLMLKINVDVKLKDGTSKAVSYMLKLAPTNEKSKEMLDMFNTFQKELIMYNEVIPKLQRLYSEAGLSNVNFGPKTYQLSKDPGCETLLMDNMCLQGFKTAGRLSGLNMEHTECVLRKLAQLHAASAHWYAISGSVPEALTKSIFVEENRAITEPVRLGFFNSLLECLKSYKGSEKYADKVIQWTTPYFDMMINAAKIDKNNFNVINHGDCWINNIMFQYNNDGSIKDTSFIDFQISEYGSPALDLYYFILSSTSLDIKVEKFDQLIEFYHANLKEYLELLKYPKDIPTLQHIQNDLQKYNAWAFSTVVGIMAAVLLEPTEDANVENYLAEDEAGMEWKRSMFSNDRYRSHAEVLFPWLDERGLLDLK